MDKGNTNRAQLWQASLATALSTTPLALILRQLHALTVPPATLNSYRVKREARVQAVRWLNRLDTTEELDELWPAFEAWLTRRPENLRQYLAAERTRRALDELSRWCPPEGSEEAEQLLRLSNAPPRRDRTCLAGAGRWALVGTSLMASLVAICLAIA